jgi:endonuclease YncB( thermonuclease family)
MPPGRQRSDEERRAMWARMGGGGGGRGGSHGASGSWEGQKGGASGSWEGDQSFLEWAREQNNETARLRENGLIVEGAFPSWLVPGSGALKVGKAALTSFSTGTAADAIGKYRKAHPELSPTSNHYLAMLQKYLGYASAISGLASLKAGIKGITPKSWKEGIALPFKKLGDWLGSAGTWIKGKSPGWVNSGMAPIASASARITDLTGATLTDVARIGHNRNTLAIAKKLKEQATAIEAVAGHLSSQQKQKALDYLDQAHKLSMSGKPGAAKLYQDSRDAFNAAATGSASSQRAADSMRKYAAALTSDATSGLQKAGLVVAGTIAKETYDEHKINKMADQMRALFDENKTWTEQAEKPMSGYQMAMALAAGIHGNAAEKNFRYGTVNYYAQAAAYRAKHDMITDALKAGVITEKGAKDAYAKLKKEEPWDMGGKAPWLFAPASAAAIVWKVGDAIDKASRSTIDRRQVGSYIDGDTVVGASGRTNRLSDINAPEVAHAHSNDPNHPERRTGEFLGPESASFADRILKEGQHFRAVEDSHPSAGGTDKYGRDIRSIETLPRPFDKLLAIPGVGKIIPAREYQASMIAAGMADIDYRELTKYKGDNLQAHDSARQKAQAAKLGIWSPEAEAAYAEYARTNANFKPWVGTENTMYDRKVKQAKKDGFDIPKEPASDFGTWAGLGLMTSGQSGAFGAMGEKPGGAAAWAWNAAVAITGLYDYHQKAIRAPAPRTYSKPVGIPSALDQRVARDLESTRRRTWESSKNK